MAYRKKTYKRKYGRKTYKRNYRKKTYKRKTYGKKPYKRTYRKKTYGRRGVVLRPVTSKLIPVAAWNKIDTATIKTIDLLEDVSKKIAATAVLTVPATSALDSNKKRALDGAMAM